MDIIIIIIIIIFYNNNNKNDPSLVLPMPCGKCYVSKLRDCCFDMAENSQKKNWRGSPHDNNNNDIAPEI